MSTHNLLGHNAATLVRHAHASLLVGQLNPACLLHVAVLHTGEAALVQTALDRLHVIDTYKKIAVKCGEMKYF